MGKANIPWFLLKHHLKVGLHNGILYYMYSILQLKLLILLQKINYLENNIQYFFIFKEDACAL